MMDPRQILQVGRQVFLERLTGERLERFTFYITDVKLDRFSLTALTRSDAGLSLSPGETVRVYIPTPMRIYQFDAQVLERSPHPSLPFVLSMPEVLIPVQRRQFVRVHGLYEAEIAPINSQGVGAFLPVIGVDIGGGGAGLRVFRRRLPPSFPLQIGQLFCVRLFLPPISPDFPKGLSLETKGTLVTLVREQDEIRPDSWRMGLAFLGMDSKTQERIVAWCFAFQRRLLRQGLERKEEER